LDDVDILAAIKGWEGHPDPVLSKLCHMIINRKLLTIKIKNSPVDPAKFERHFGKVRKRYGLDDGETSYFVFTGEIGNRAYDQERQNINILARNGKITDVAKASDQLNLKALSKTVTKYYICYPKDDV
jgi:hypothetical protein